jgi:CDP-diacylglycerol--glycerol-3-phosphate 3-phosphatidyltransferase/cardiolipin synthase
MTLATRITLVRFVAIPAFLMLAVVHQRVLDDGFAEQAETLRLWMLGVFVLACITDGIDGYVARAFDQRTKIGAMLDALADKMLMLTAIVTLSLLSSPINLPVWFACLVIGRDFLLVIGALYLHFTGRRLEIKPHWTGKVSTVLQMAVIGWVFLQISAIDILYPTVLAAGFTLAAGLIYLKDGLELVLQQV